MIPVSNVVNVTILTSPIFPARRGFGLLLILGNSTTLPLAERSREYENIDDVQTDFGTNAEEYKAAQKFFSQSPNPRVVRIGRRITAAAPGENYGGSAPTTDIALWQAVTTGSMDISIDGTVKHLTALTFAADGNLNAVAARIQAALVTAGAAGATVVWTGSRFIIRSGTTGAASTMGYAVPPGTGTFIGTMLGATQAAGARLTNGIAIETAAAALSAQQDYNTEWYGATFTSHASQQDLLDAAEWTEARVKMFGYTTAASDVLDPVATTDVASQMAAKGYRRTVGIYDNDDAYAICSFLARGYAVNFNEQNSTITMKFKILPGVTPSDITTTQKSTLDKKKINYYTKFGDSAMVAESYMASGVFFDEVHGLDWFQNAIETNVFGFLYTRTTKVPQTDRGMTMLVQQVRKACDQGVYNGLLAPGTWTGDEFGTLHTDDYLKTGYYIYPSPMSTQNQSDREARIAPPIQVAAKGSGAIHFANVTVSFNR